MLTSSGLAAPKAAIVRKDFAALRSQFTQIGAALADAERELPALDQTLKGTADLNQQNALRLQMSLDRLSKMMATISNLLKKAADTQNAIVQNLKG